MKITEKDLKYMISECVKHILKEDWKPIHFKHTIDGEDFDDYDGDEWIGDKEPESEEDNEKQRIIDNCDYSSFVVVDDSDGSILSNYTSEGIDDAESYDEAIENARQRSLDNKYGTYSVFGCIDNVYDDDTLIDTFYMGKRQ